MRSCAAVQRDIRLGGTFIPVAVHHVNKLVIYMTKLKKGKIMTTSYDDSQSNRVVLDNLISTFDWLHTLTSSWFIEEENNEYVIVNFTNPVDAQLARETFPQPPSAAVFLKRLSDN